MSVAAMICGYLLVVGFALSGFMKLAGAKPMRKSADHLGLSFGTFRLVGVAEIAGAAGLILGRWTPALRVAAAAGLFLLMVGAVRYHLRAKDPIGQVAPAAVLGLLSLAIAIQAVLP